MTKGTPWAKGRRRLETAKGRGCHGRQRPPRDEDRHRLWLTKGINHEEGVAMGQREKVVMGQREGVAVGAKGLKTAEKYLKAKGLGKFPWLKVPL